MANTATTFRSYTPADTAALPDLFMRAIKTADPELEDGPWIDDLRHPEESYGHGSDIIVGIIGDKIVAMGSLKRLNEQTVEMKRVCVDPKQQGKGLGKKLLSALEVRAKTLGASKIVLDSPHKIAINMYRQNGYKEIKAEDVDHPSGHMYHVIFFEKYL
jgi:ribosomal protein S18 acetylase RimI-like enzyme